MAGDLVKSDAGGAPVSVEAELADIRQLRRNDPHAYDLNKALQARELELIDAKLKGEREPIAEGELAPASAVDIERFASTPEGKAVVSEWGDAAPAKLAVLRSRVENILLGMGEREADATLDWFDGLSADDAADLYRQLAG